MASSTWSLLLTLKKWLVITQNRGWSLTHFYFETPGSCLLFLYHGWTPPTSLPFVKCLEALGSVFVGSFGKGDQGETGNPALVQVLPACQVAPGKLGLPHNMEHVCRASGRGTYLPRV